MCLEVRKGRKRLFTCNVVFFGKNDREKHCLWALAFVFILFFFSFWCLNKKGVRKDDFHRSKCCKIYSKASVLIAPWRLLSLLKHSEIIKWKALWKCVSLIKILCAVHRSKQAWCVQGHAAFIQAGPKLAHFASHITKWCPKCSPVHLSYFRCLKSLS